MASIVFVLFLALFSLDVFEPGRSAAEILVGLLMHNIPVFVLAALTAIAWKCPLVGGISFIVPLRVGSKPSPSGEGFSMVFWSHDQRIPDIFA